MQSISTGSNKTSVSRFWESSTLNSIFFDEIATAPQQPPIFQEICTAAPPIHGKLLRSFCPCIKPTKEEEGKQNLGHDILKACLPRFCLTLYIDLQFRRSRSRSIFGKITHSDLDHTKDQDQCGWSWSFRGKISDLTHLCSRITKSGRWCLQSPDSSFETDIMVSCFVNFSEILVYLASCRIIWGFHTWRPQNVRIFWPPPPLVTVTNQLILSLSSAFWGPPSPHPLRTSYMEAP